MTPHIKAKKGEIAKTVLMPGDPLRAKYIAETFLTDVKQVNSIRNMFMYTGKYKGKKVSICGSGMGQPSMGIYSYELYKYYDVDRIIRIGTAGAYKKDLKVYEVFMATSSYSDSTAFNQLVTGKKSHITYPSKELLEKIRKAAAQEKITLHEGRVHSSDVFYSIRPLKETIKVTGADCVEMESAALFANAAATGKQAACIVTISDNLVTNTVTSPEERQTAFTSMMKIALDLV